MTEVSSRPRLAARIAPAAVGALVGVALPLAAWDADIQRALVDELASSSPFDDVFVVSMSSQSLSSPDCGTELDALLHGRAEAVLLTPPVGTTCPPPDGSPWTSADESMLTVRSDGRVVGHAADSEAESLLSVGRPGRVPAAAFEDLSSETVPPEALGGKTVVVGAQDPHWSSTYSVGGERVSLATAVAAAVGASEAGARVSPVGRLGASLLGALAGWLVGAVGTRLGSAASFVTWAGLLGALHAAQLLATGNAGWTLPEASLGLALTLAFFVSNLTAERGEQARRAVTTDLVKRATLFRPQGRGEVHGDATWQRLATTIAELYPSAGVAIYEHPAGGRRATADVDQPDVLPGQLPSEWLTSGDGAAEGAPRVLEPNPEHGLPRGAVLCPLDDGKAVLGHTLLLGKTAVQTHQRAPARTQALSEQIAVLLRRSEADTTPRRDRRWARGDEALTEAAATAAEDRHALASMLDGLPVGLLYADSFGDVRMLGQAFRDVLEQSGVGFDAAEGGIVEPRQLSLRGVIAPLSGLSPQRVSERLSELWGQSEIVSFELSVGDQEQRRLLLQVGVTRATPRAPRTYFGVLVDQTALYSRLAGSSEAMRLFQTRAADICMAIQGLALFEDEASLRESVPRIAARADELMDALTAFAPAVEGTPDQSNAPFSLLNVTRSASALLGARPRGVTFDAPVTVDAVRGPRSELLRALHALLEHLTAEVSESPVLITLREWRSDVELTIVDPAYGAPASILAELDAHPEAATSEQAPVAQLLELVRRTGGQASLLGDAGTGLTLTIRLRKQTVGEEEIVDIDETRAF